MTCQLPADCLNEIFEYLEKDKISLHSCLLVNRLWCEEAVRILWKDVWNFYCNTYSQNQTHMSLAILGTLVACLPDESKNLLYTNGIFIPTPTSNPPSLNYISLIKVLSTNDVDRMIEVVLTNQQISTSQSLDDDKSLVSQELLKAFMNQISSLKSLHCDFAFVEMVPFTCFPRVNDCLTDLSVFNCDSNIYPEFFHQLSQICHNIQSITIEFRNKISDGLKELTFSQNNLKYLRLLAQDKNCDNWEDIIPALTKHHNTLLKLHVYGGNGNRLPFIALFVNLQELVLSNLFGGDVFEEFNELQYVTFLNLRILKIP